jgi:hypothetical protein
MRYVLILALLATGCAFIDETSAKCRGLKAHDPQLCLGEQFQQIPNLQCEINGKIYPEAICRDRRGEVW